MKKALVCIFLVLSVLSLICVPAFASTGPETTAASDPSMGGFIGSDISPVVISYSVSVSNLSVGSSLRAWLTSIGAVSSDSAVGSCYAHTGTSFNTGSIYLDGSSVVMVDYGSVSTMSTFSYFSSSALGYDAAVAAFGSGSVTAVYSSGSFVGDVWDAEVSVWGKLVNFVTSSWLPMVGIAMFTLVSVLGISKRFITGV